MSACAVIGHVKPRATPYIIGDAGTVRINYDVVIAQRQGNPELMSLQDEADCFRVSDL
jgi:hypothetical protein